MKQKTMMIKEKLRAIRAPKPLSPKRAALSALAVLLAGIALGVFSKWLDDLALDSTIWWHRIAERLDLGNFFSDFAVWLLLALIIAVFSRSALQAAGNVFAFFAGMCAAYHLCTVWFSGFHPGSYMMIWYAITLFSPVLAVCCWYAKGRGTAALLLQTAIIAVLVLSCFSLGWIYVDLRGVLYLLAFLGGAAVLYSSPKQSLISVPAGFLLAFLCSPLWPSL